MIDTIFYIFFRTTILMIPSILSVPVGVDLGFATLSIADIAVLSIFAMYLIDSAANGMDSILSIRTRFISVILLLAVVTNSVIMSGAGADSVKALLRFYEEGMLLIVLDRVLPRFSLKTSELLLSLQIAGCVTAAYILGDVFFWGTVGRAGTVYHGASVGVIPAGACSAYLYQTVARSKRGLLKRLITAILFSFCFAGIYFTYTRTWILAIFASITLAAFLRFRKQRIVLLVLLCCLIVTTMLLPIFSHKTAHIKSTGKGTMKLGEIYQFISGSTEKTTIGSRILKWYKASRIAYENPLTGVGLDNINLGLPSHLDPFSNKRSDNQYIDFLASNGIPAFCLFVFMMIWLLLALGRNYCATISTRDTSSACFFLIFFTWAFGGIFWAILPGYTGLIFVVMISFCLHSIRLTKSLSPNGLIISASLDSHLA